MFDSIHKTLYHNFIYKHMKCLHLIASLFIIIFKCTCLAITRAYISPQFTSVIYQRKTNRLYS